MGVAFSFHIPIFPPGLIIDGPLNQELEIA